MLPVLCERNQALTLNKEFGDPDIISVVELKACCDLSPEQPYYRAFAQPHNNLLSAF